ncbi:MAG: TrkA family potassium uptake protein [Spirochaetales bacterium]|nr:TrkA family potassium uptake protein [Spirochaetales bacterium]
MRNRNRIAIIGIGSFGWNLLHQLIESGHEVLAIDKEMGRVEKAAELAADAVCLEATDSQALADQELHELDLIIVTLAHFESLITCASILMEQKVRRLLVRAQTPLEEKILRMLGVTELFDPDEQASRNLVRHLFESESLQRMQPLGLFRIVEIPVPGALMGKRIMDVGLRLKYRLNLITVRRKDSEGKSAVLGVPDPEGVIVAGDRWVIFGHRQDLEIFLNDYS